MSSKLVSISSSSSSSSELFSCDMNIHYNLLGSGSYSVVIKPYISNVDLVLYENPIDIRYEYVAKIYTQENKEEFEKELSILRMISAIDNYTDFTVPIKSAASFDISELQDEVDILRKLTTNGKKIFKPKEKLYEIVIGYGGVNLSSLHKEYSHIILSFSTFMNIIREFYNGIYKLQTVGIIHRDIKPVNVLFDHSKLHIIDFSISCEIKELYTNHPDQMYILSYMYMYNAPEFYIAYLMFKNEENGMDFTENLNDISKKMGKYSTEMETFYYQHYYRYNSSEPYNIFSYKQGFNKFFETIWQKNINSIQELFTDDIAYKSDIYSTYFILKQLKKYIIFESIAQKQIFNVLCEMTSEINPFQRSSVTEIINYIDNNMFC